jgi:hypothetical protein
MNFLNKPQILMNEADDNNGGGSGYESDTKDTSAQSASGDTGSEAEGDSFDELGYPIVQEEGSQTKEKKESKSDEKKADDKKEPATKATGYGEEPPVEDKKPDEQKVDDKKPDEKKPDEESFEIKVEGLEKEELDKLNQFAKQHKVSKEVAQAYAENRARELKEAQLAYDKQVSETKRQWHNELKTDPTFGGEKYGYNVMQAEKVLEDFMPGLKKSLTERGAMLPPYVMKDLANLANTLYANDKFVNGDPSGTKDEKDEDDPLAFYG